MNKISNPLECFHALLNDGFDQPKKSDLSIEFARALVTIEEIDHLITVSGMKLPFITLINFETGRRPWNSRGIFVGGTGRASPFELFRQFIECKSTMVFPHAHRTFISLSRLVSELKKMIEPMTMQSNVYLSPPNAIGAGAHVDQHHTLLIQISGKKCWRIWRNIDRDPTSPTISNTDEEISAVTKHEAPVFFVELGVGNTLLIPRGFIHEGVTGDAHSLHVTLGVVDPAPRDASILRYGVEMKQQITDYCMVL